jgi:hypothetical protein
MSREAGAWSCLNFQDIALPVPSDSAEGHRLTAPQQNMYKQPIQDLGKKLSVTHRARLVLGICHGQQEVESTKLTLGKAI